MDAIEKQFYRYCLTHNKLYFGSIMRALQGSSIRHAYMQLLAEEECRDRRERSFNIVEVGSWAGGSAITWAEAIKRFNKGKGFVFCIDKWEPFFDPSQCSNENLEVYREMSNALVNGTIYDLFLHNIKASGHSDIIVPIRGWSNDVLPLLGKEMFDLVFVDGDHRYTNILNDLINSAPLVSKGGIMCGDDLELQLSQLDVEHARKHAQMDFIIDPKTKKYYHPGVSLAVGEFFGEVSVWEGFWAIRKKETHWEKVELSNTFPESIIIPEHLEKQKASNYLRFGEELYAAGRIVEAEKAFLEARTLAPNSAEVNKALAVVCWKLRNLPKATEFMQQALELNQYNSNVIANHALIAQNNRKNEINCLSGTREDIVGFKEYL